jgi:hypothetical protein
MSRDCENRHGASMAIEEPVDEMKVAGTATPGADGKLASNVRVSPGGKRRHFLVADVNPFDRLLSAYLVDYPIERIANYSVNSLHSRRGERRYQAFCYRRHILFPPP